MVAPFARQHRWDDWPTSPALAVRSRLPAAPDRGERAATDQRKAGDELPAPAIGYRTYGRCWRCWRLCPGLLRPRLLCDLLALSLRAVCAGALLDVRLSHHALLRCLAGPGDSEIASDPGQMRRDMESVSAVGIAAHCRWPVWRSFLCGTLTLSTWILTVGVGPVIAADSATASGIDRRLASVATPLTAAARASAALSTAASCRWRGCGESRTVQGYGRRQVRLRRTAMISKPDQACRVRS